MQNFQRLVSTSLIISELSHVFCCVLPTLFTLLTCLVTLGAVSAMPVFMSSMHEIMHAYEIPVIVFSGVMLTVGWGLHLFSKKLDCRSTGCGHEPCAPVKTRSSKLLMVITALFICNLLIYFAFHAPQGEAHDRASEAHAHRHAH